MKYCHKCRVTWESAGAFQPGFKEVCSNCSTDLHTCLNCTFYDEHKPGQCRIPNIETIVDKNRFNFCEEFMFSDRLPGENKPRPDEKSKKAWENLFKKKL